MHGGCVTGLEAAQPGSSAVQSRAVEARCQLPACNCRKGILKKEIGIAAVTLHTPYNISINFTCPRNSGDSMLNVISYLT